MSIASRIKRFDLYAQIPVDLTNPTATGSVISIVAAVIMVYLFISECISVAQWETKVDMIVERDDGDKLHMNINMTFPKFPCFVFSLDVVDAMGRHEVGLSSTLVQTRLASDGSSLGEYRHQPSDAELQAMRNEGCHVAGFVAVNKVPGNFHISAHSSMHLVQHYLHNEMNLQHVIHSLWIGDHYLTPKQFPGLLHPLDGTTHLTEPSTTIYEYFLDIIPTTYTKGRSSARGYQIVAHRQSNPSGQSMPAIFFRYSLSPMQVVYDTQRKSFSHFLVYLCAIVGGVFTVAGIVNGLLQGSIKVVQKNLLGKAD